MEASIVRAGSSSREAAQGSSQRPLRIVPSDRSDPTVIEEGAHASIPDDTWSAEHRALTRFLRGRTSHEEAQDIAQQSIVRLLGGQVHGSIRDLGAYLRRTAINLLRDDARSAARRSNTQCSDVDDLSLAAADQVAMLEARDTLRRVEASLAGLTPLTRDIFIAHRVDGYSYAEIARRTGLTTKAVERRMSKAIAHVDRVASSWR